MNPFGSSSGKLTSLATQLLAPVMAQAPQPQPMQQFGQPQQPQPTQQMAHGRLVDPQARMSDGMSDGVPARIDGVQPAEVTSGEYIVPADAVSGLGNGSTAAGAQQLDQMVGRTRKMRTGGITQAPQINPQDAMPV